MLKGSILVAALKRQRANGGKWKSLVRADKFLENEKLENNVCRWKNITLGIVLMNIQKGTRALKYSS